MKNFEVLSLDSLFQGNDRERINPIGVVRPVVIEKFQLDIPNWKSKFLNVELSELSGLR